MLKREIMFTLNSRKFFDHNPLWIVNKQLILNENKTYEIEFLFCSYEFEFLKFGRAFDMNF